MSNFKNNFVTGFTAAVVATILAPILVPAIKKSGRPLAKSLVKGGIVLYEKSRELVAGAGEMMEDVIAEVRIEAMEKQHAMAGAEDIAAGEETTRQAYPGNGDGRFTGDKNDGSSPYVVGTA